MDTTTAKSLAHPAAATTAEATHPLPRTAIPFHAIDGTWRLSSAAAVALAHCYRLAQVQRKRFADTVRRGDGQVVDPDTGRPMGLTLTRGNWAWFDVSISELARRMGCHRKTAAAAMRELMGRVPGAEVPALVVSGDAVSGGDVPAYRLAYTFGDLKRRGYEYVTLRKTGTMRIRHLSLVMQRHRTVYRCRKALARILRCDVKTVTRLVRQLESEGELLVGRQSGRKNVSVSRLYDRTCLEMSLPLSRDVPRTQSVVDKLLPGASKRRRKEENRSDFGRAAHLLAGKRARPRRKGKKQAIAEALYRRFMAV